MVEDFDDAGARTIQQVATGIYQTQALYVATKLGVADLLSGGPQPAGVLAKQLGVRPDRLYRVLRYLCALGVFEQAGDGVFANNAASEHLRSTGQGSMGDLALLFGEEFYRAWGNLLEAVRTGRDAFGIEFGCGLFEYLEQNQSRGRIFDRAMAGGSAFLDAVPGSWDFSSMESIVDVGGGNGAALGALLAEYPELKGVLFETSSVLEAAGENLRRQGLGDRCELVAGNFFESVPPGADGYLLSRVLHDWTDEQCVRILGNCRAAMGSGGRLMVVERLVPGLLALGADLNMLAVTQGRERTRQEMEALLSDSGFALRQVLELPLEAKLLIAEPL
ncbi:MAG: methyltransferase [Actinomycetota bacterium]